MTLYGISHFYFEMRVMQALFFTLTPAKEPPYRKLLVNTRFRDNFSNT